MTFVSAFTNKPSGPGFTVVEDLHGTNDGTRSPIFSPGGDRGNLFQAHHLIGSATANRFQEFFQRLSDIGDYEHNNYKSNGVFLPTSDADALRLGVSKHIGSHSAYDKFVDARIAEISGDADQLMMNRFEAYQTATNPDGSRIYT